MERQDVYFVLFDQQKDFSEWPENLVEREAADKVARMRSLKLPIVITGVRQCGKSTLMKILRRSLGLGGKDFLYVNFYDERLSGFSSKDFQAVLDFLAERGYREDAALFLDEIQEAGGWEKFVDRVRSRHAVFLSGSNSKLLSREISTVLTGRSLSVDLFPFGFGEFLHARGVDARDWKADLGAQARIRRAFAEYLEMGGFPQAVSSRQKIVLQELYENILYRDIISRFGKTLEPAIKEISLHLLSNASKPTSLRSLSGAAGIKNLATVKAILDAFESAFLFFFVNKFDYSLKKQLQNPRKAYCIDNGFVCALGFRFTEDKGRLLENLVAIELKRRGKEIFYSKDKGECDIVVKEGLKVRHAVQVTYALNDGNRERELDGLLEAMKQFKLRDGILLTYDQERILKIGGKTVRVVPVWKWLLQDK